jgi:hypothetical protein
MSAGRGANRRSFPLRGARAELCGLVARGARRSCVARTRPEPRLYARVVALGSCLSFGAALALATFVSLRGPTGIVPHDPQTDLPVAAVANHSIDDFFRASH